MEEIIQNLMKRMKQTYESVNSFDNTSFEKCVLLSYLFTTLNYSTYLEFTENCDASFLAIGEAIKQKGGKGYGLLISSQNSENVDFPVSNEKVVSLREIIKREEGEQTFPYWINLIDSKNLEKTIEIFKQKALDSPVCISTGESIDLLFIKAGNTGAVLRNTIEKYRPFLTDNSVIIFDNLSQDTQMELFDSFKGQYAILHESSYLGILTKANDENFQEIQKRLVEVHEFLKMPQEIWQPLDLVIVDDVFPAQESAFRYDEFTEYLKAFPNSRIYSNGGSLFLLSKETIEEKIAQYENRYPQFQGRIISWRNRYGFPSTLNAKLAYFCFLQNAYLAIEELEARSIPFVFELYPGGRFALYEKQSDEWLKRVTSSPCFRRVIVTQKITHDYLIENKFCRDDQITLIFGGVFPGAGVTPKIERSYYLENKQHMDICFVAMKYTSRGEDKGYDAFVEVAQQLCKEYDNINFHVVGSFDKSVIDISSIEDKITFYGVQKKEWLNTFFLEMDIILSPNRAGKIFKGNFDGFPTGCCVDAGRAGTVICCTDELGQNAGFFAAGKELEIISDDTEMIVSVIKKYYLQPGLLRHVGTAGKNAIQHLYSLEVQMKPRIQLLKEEVGRYLPNLLDISQNMIFRTNPHMERYSRLLRDYQLVEQDARFFREKFITLENYTRELQKKYNILYTNQHWSRKISKESMLKRLQRFFTNIL